MGKLAINGGKPVRTRPFPRYNTIGKEEKKAVNRVLSSGILSRFLGCWDKDFYGGKEIQALEYEWAKYFRVKHAIAVNSCTSGLYCAVGAVGVEPGQEIIVSPYTMSASATAALIFNAVPVFADIEEDYFCIDPESIEKKITSRTKAIIIVDIFGLPYNADAINKIAKKRGIFVIEDAAQAPGALYKNRFAGTLGDIGVYSLNYHKHIHCGEGGIVVANNDRLAERVRLIRNHAESVVEDKKVTDLANMIGFNFRMTEIEAAIARSQLRKLKKLLRERQENCDYFARHISDIPALKVPKVRPGCTHAYYAYPIKFNENIAGISRKRFVEAVSAELVPVKSGLVMNLGYAKPLYLQPMYQKKIAYGSSGCPFKKPWYDGNINYRKGICPVTERMYEKELFSHELIKPSMAKKDLDDVIKAFHKAWQHRDEL
ncbi:MAG TPA: DegT/DnrJ/EryC1/StrS family aminotransferase [Candidatus Omnitrophica bacterium]|nr:DegT/DnrJ/EryC1/StrS family aminotransferase [Candidatus Omnitrophota bacterium]